MEQTPLNRRALYTRLALRAVLLACAVLLISYAGSTVFSLLAPFLFALLFAFLLNPLVNILNRKLHLPRKPVTLILVIVVFSGLLALIGWFFYAVISEVISLAVNFDSIWSDITAGFNYLIERLEWVLEYLPSDTEGTLDSIVETIYLWLETAIGSLLNVVVTNMAPFISSISGGIFGVVVFILAAYFITAEYPTIGSRTRKYLGQSIYGYLRILRNAVKSALGGYFRYQLLLALLAFAVMFIALLIYGQSYALLIALLLGFVDFIPLLGTAVILVPWALFEMAMGDMGKGIFLLILAGGFFILRRMVEPKIVGSQTGLHPLVALMSIFFGMRLIGILGAILGPIIMMILVSIVSSGIFDNTFKDLKDMAHDISSHLRRPDEKPEVQAVPEKETASPPTGGTHPAEEPHV